MMKTNKDPEEELTRAVNHILKHISLGAFEGIPPNNDQIANLYTERIIDNLDWAVRRIVHEEIKFFCRALIMSDEENIFACLDEVVRALENNGENEDE